MSDLVPIQAGEKVARSRDKKNAAIQWPRAVDARLDQLHELATNAGERTTRAELAAAIIVATDAEGERLRQLLTNYRLKTNREVLIGDAPSGDVVQLKVHRPGPRKRN